jgi:23S rRNA pseudouridine2605 synthase
MSNNKGRKNDGRPGSPGKPQGSRKPAAGKKPTDSRKPKSDKPFSNRPPRAEKPAGEKRGDYKDRNERSETGGRSNFADKPKREERPERPNRPMGDKPFRNERDDRPGKAFGDKPFRSERDERPRKPAGEKPYAKKPFEKREGGYKKEGRGGDFKPRTEGKSGYQHPEKPYKNFRKVKGRSAEELDSNDGTMRLNRVLSTAGIASRRDADALITAGLVTVNGKVVTELGTKVSEADEVKYNGERIRAERKVYVVMNKPKGFITTVEDEKARKTVMELMAGKISERIYPVGRLDRGTTGVLLFTNDGDLAKKLTHPSHGARKIYQVSLDKPLTAAHLRDIKAGVELEDGVVPVDEVSYIDDKAKTNVGLELHVGRNRIVRRLFEQLGYEVVKLDRVNFAGLTKKNLARGQWRYLTAQELNYLKMLK